MPVLELGPEVQRVGIDGLPVSVGGITGSTPIIGLNDLIYLGTTAGMLVTSKDGLNVRVFNNCNGQTVGPVSGTAAINANNDVVFGDDTGRAFAFTDDGTAFECLWIFPAPSATPIPNGIVSSPLIFADFERQLTNSYFGTGSGHVQALNVSGTAQWRFPAGSAAFPGPVTSSLASDGAAFHVAAPDGNLYTLDRAGRLQYQAQISLPGNTTPLLPSPMLGSSIYGLGIGGRCGASSRGCLLQTDCPSRDCGALGEAGLLTALTPLDEVRWRFATDTLVAGSAAFVVQPIDEPALPAATPVPTGTPPTPDLTATPTPTPTRFTAVLEGIVYLVDTAGTVYGVKDVSGELFVARATLTPTPTLAPGANTPTSTPIGQPTDAITKLAKAELENAVRVTASPVLSDDLFVVFGTDFGFVYAIRLDFDRTVPCAECDESESVWDIVPLKNELGGGGGRVELRTGSGDPVVSSPVIDDDGTIFVTAGRLSTGQGTLYAVGTP